MNASKRKSRLAAAVMPQISQWASDGHARGAANCKANHCPAENDRLFITLFGIFFICVHLHSFADNHLPDPLARSE
ncbi:hypothetical protein [uncultured Thiodictyon sp.]|uniref:hypothetical protein n=1 Tax=uncultured Thiodictyon sp. TaxID=1846217 RepID=UPI0025FF024B|nr:hypothetical protein [uncultured Thiodictyon sp.]